MIRCQSKLRLAITGGFLGSLCTFASYGAGGALILSILIGSLLVIGRRKSDTVSATLVYTFSVCAFFYAVGFSIISEPLSGQTLMIFLLMIAVPGAVAAVVAGFRGSPKRNNAQLQE